MLEIIQLKRLRTTTATGISENKNNKKPTDLTIALTQNFEYENAIILTKVN